MNKASGTGSIDKSTRVRSMKRVLIGIAAILIVLPTLLCIILFIKLNRMEKQLYELSYEKEKITHVTDSTYTYEPVAGEPEVTDADADTVYKTEYVIEPGREEIAAAGAPDDESCPGMIKDLSDVNDSNAFRLRKVYLTFDDGPSNNTGEILDILDRYGVKATFFVVGKPAESLTPFYKEIIRRGHTIGMHSYSHKYSEVYASKDAFLADLGRIQSFVYDQTGILPTIYRFPGGSSNTVSNVSMKSLELELEKRNIRYFDWNVVSGDASSRILGKDEIVRNCIEGVGSLETAMILMHDLDEKVTTVEALPEVIESFLDMGVEIAPISDETEQIVHITTE